MKEETIEKIKRIIQNNPLGKTTIAEITKKLTVNPKTAERYLLEMELMNILKRESINKTDKYSYKWWRLNNGHN